MFKTLFPSVNSNDRAILRQLVKQGLRDAADCVAKRKLTDAEWKTAQAEAAVSGSHKQSVPEKVAALASQLAGVLGCAKGTSVGIVIDNMNGAPRVRSYGLQTDEKTYLHIAYHDKAKEKAYRAAKVKAPATAKK